MSETLMLDGTAVPFGKTIRDLVKGRDIIAAKINGNAVDLSTELTGTETVETIKADSKEGLDVIRHSCACLLYTSPSPRD